MRANPAILGGLALAFAFAMSTSVAHAASIDVKGDVFVGTDGGQIFQYAPDGTLIQKFQSPITTKDATGMAFDSSGVLYSTNFADNQIVKFNQNGAFIGTFGSGLNTPESIVFDKSGNAYVGQADEPPGVPHSILKFDPAGNLLSTILTQGNTDRGTDWIDLAADQRTLYYNGEGATMRKVDAITGVIKTFTSQGSQMFALRIMPNGNILAANTSNVLMFDPNGNIFKIYDQILTGVTGPAELFALNLDPDGTSFWTADDKASTGVWKVDIATGNILEHFQASKDGVRNVLGLVVFDEITVGGPSPGGPSPVPAPASLVLLGVALAGLALLGARRRKAL